MLSAKDFFSIASTGSVYSPWGVLWVANIVYTISHLHALLSSRFFVYLYLPAFTLFIANFSRYHTADGVPLNLFAPTHINTSASRAS